MCSTHCNNIVKAAQCQDMAQTVTRLMKLEHSEFQSALQTYKTLALTTPILVAGVQPVTKARVVGVGKLAGNARSPAFGQHVYAFGAWVSPARSESAYVAPATGNRRRGRGRGRGRRTNTRGSGGWRGRGGNRGRPRGARGNQGTERAYQRIGKSTTTELSSLLSLHTECLHTMCISQTLSRC